MQKVSEIYERIYNSHNYYVETSLVIGERGVLITELGQRILFGGYAILLTENESQNDYGYGEHMLISVRTTKRVFKDNIPQVGCCPCGEIYVEMHMPIGEIKRKSIVIPYVRLVSNDTGECSEWIKKGVFYIDTRDNTHNRDELDILSIHGYDAMMRAEVDYGEFFENIPFSITDWTKTNGKYYATVSNPLITLEKDVSVTYEGDESIAFSSHVRFTQSLGNVTFEATETPPVTFSGNIVLSKKNTIAFPARDIDVVMDIASKMGVMVDEESIALDENNNPLPKEEQPYINKEYTIQYPSTYTMRETLGYIGAMYGGNWVMNDIGELQFIPLNGLPKETSLIITEYGDRIVFGEEPPTRILIEEVS